MRSTDSNSWSLGFVISVLPSVDLGQPSSQEAQFSACSPFAWSAIYPQSQSTWFREAGKDFVNMTQKALNVKDNSMKLKWMLVDSKTLKKVKSHKLGEDHFNTHNYEPLRHRQLEKWGNDRNRYFTDTETWMANKHMENCSSPLVMDMKIKITKRYYFTNTRLEKSLIVPSIGKILKIISYIVF